MSARFPEFARYAWNRPPGDFFKQWDSLTALPVSRELQSEYPKLTLPQPIVLNEGEEERSFSANETEVEPLAADYYRFSFSAFASGTVDPKYVRINNPFGALPEYGSVQVGYRIAGQNTWTFDDISGSDAKSFCLLVPSQLVDEVVVIVANAHYQTFLPAFSKPLVVARDSCPGLTGTASVQWSEINGPRNPSTVTATATDILAIPSDSQSDGELFEVVGGTLTWNYHAVCVDPPDPPQGSSSCNADIEGCVTDGVATRKLKPGDGYVLIKQAGGGITYSMFGSTTAAPLTMTFTATCNRSIEPVPIAAEWLCVLEGASNDPARLQGDFVYEPRVAVFSPANNCPIMDVNGTPNPDGTGGGRTVTYEWNLTS